MPLAPIPQSQTATQGVQFDAASQVSSNGYKYDARGQMTQSPDGTFKWNGASQLVGIGQATLAYNGLGDIVSRGTTQFGYNYALGLAPIVAETSGAATARYYVWTPNGELLYTIENTKPLFYHFDRTGSTIALTDANGRVTDAYAYDPYGKMLGHAGKSTQPFTFTGRWGVRQESATLYHMRVRYYDATTQRFLSRDPIWPQIADAREMNPYLYVGDDPLNYVDVTGLGPDTFGNPRVTYVGRRDSTDMTGSHPGPEFDDMWGFSNEEFRKMLPPNAPQMQQPRHVTVQGIGGSRDSASKFWSLVAKSVLGSKTYRTDGFSQDLVWDFNTLLEVAKQSTIDDQERVKLYAQAEQIINVDDPVMIPLYWYTRVTLTQPWIQGRSVEQKHEFFYNYKVLRE
jgi:RHS repeat-associated protein